MILSAVMHAATHGDGIALLPDLLAGTGRDAEAMLSHASVPRRQSPAGDPPIRSHGVVAERIQVHLLASWWLVPSAAQRAD